jgi:hypothetical protein
VTLPGPAVQPTRRRSVWVLIAVALLLALAVGGAVLLGSGREKPPVLSSASTEPSPTASAIPASPSLPSVPTLWRATRSMVTARQFPTATRLGNGEVLVVGGAGDTNTNRLASTELYDPASGVWTAAGPMIEARQYHTATLLANGQVLVAGGTGGDGAGLASAELYDPDSGSWTATGTMVEPRTGHTATLLADGTVLVAGGSSDSAATDMLASAERYDPESGTWSATGPMIDRRYYHIATLLPDGQVLVAGGYGESVLACPQGHCAHSESLASAELYDPMVGTWAGTGTMNAARSRYAAISLPDGRVLVEGGSGTGVDLQASAEVYDPRGRTWIASGSMFDARFYHTATLLANGQVLVVGGGNSSGGLVASAELYDPSSGSWTATENMAGPRGVHIATLLPDGTVLVAGGFRARGAPPAGVAIGSALLYDPGGGP